MILISGNNLQKEFGAKKLFENINFEFHDNQKIGLVGNNGVGKTTFFKMLTGEETTEKGTINYSHNLKIGYLEQQPKYENMAVKDVLMSVFSEQSKTASKMREVEDRMANCSDNDELNRLIELYSKLTEKFELIGGYDCDIKYNTIVSGLNFSDEFCNMNFEDLSGGQKTKVLLAKVLLLEPNILFLDEPTNYLDIDSLNWLEQYLKDFKGSFVVISHDRYFLDNCVNKIFELTPESMNEYNGNYSDYVIQKEKIIQDKTKDYEDQQKRLKKMDEQIKWMQSTGSNVLKAKAHQIEHKLEKIEKIEKPKIFTRKMKLNLEGKSFSKKIIEFENLCQGYNDILFENVSGEVIANDSIGIVGKNGCGKTTLIKTILGEITPIDGSVKIGDSIKVGYLDQESKFENEDNTILDVYCNETGIGQSQARNELAKLMFVQNDVFKRISVLSGGEKKRLKLAILIKKQPNLLVLDEPTNHLDLSSREQLENSLIVYQGTMIFISHDRYFLNKLSNKIWELTPIGINQVLGNYDDYLNDIECQEKTIKYKK